MWNLKMSLWQTVTLNVFWSLGEMFCGNALFWPMKIVFTDECLANPYKCIQYPGKLLHPQVTNLDEKYQKMGENC